MMRLLEANISALGANVEVQVMPPSLELRLVIEALGVFRSAVVKPATASVNTKVTIAVSPMRNAVSLIVMAEAKEGLTVSTV